MPVNRLGPPKFSASHRPSSQPDRRRPASQRGSPPFNYRLGKSESKVMSHVRKPCWVPPGRVREIGQLRVWLFFAQLAAALPGAISVVVPDHEKVWLYALAIAG